jgi:mRNA interferase MazF
MACKRADLVLVPFPFTNLSARKRRPVLCLTEPDAFGDFLGVAVTSKAHHENSVAIRPEDLVNGELPVESWVRIDRLVTLNQSLVVKGFGAVGTEFLARVIGALCGRVGFAATA